MQPDELDRLLGAERPISPSADFAAAVMSSIQREVGTPKGISFPWWPVLLGALCTTGAVGAGLVIEPPREVLGGASAAFTESLQMWTAQLAAAAMDPAATALALAALVTLVPMAVYEGYRYARG